MAKQTDQLAQNSPTQTQRKLLSLAGVIAVGVAGINLLLRIGGSESTSVAASLVTLIGSVACIALLATAMVKARRQ